MGSNPAIMATTFRLPPAKIIILSGELLASELAQHHPDFPIGGGGEGRRNRKNPKF